MSGRNQLILGLVGVLLVAIAAYFLTSSMGLGEYQAGEEGAPIEGDLADMTPGERLCAAQATTDSIRTRIFNRAREATEGDAAALTRLETGTLARMENPRLLRFDDGLEEATCEGRLVLELPRGSEPAFSDNRRLTINLVYFAQPSGNGGSTAARIEGADGLIGRLASADLTTRRREPEFPPKTEGEEDEGQDVDIDGEEEPRPNANQPRRPDPGSRDSDLPPPEDLLPPEMQSN